MTHTPLLLAATAVLLASCMPATPPAQPPAAATDHSSVHAGEKAGTGTQAADRLKGSSRHQEWVEVKRGDRAIHTWVVYPETEEKAPVVLVIHENKGLNDWARSMADQVAEAGYIAVAPDLLSGFSETRTRTSDFESDDAATQALYTLKPEDVQADLQAVADWAETIPASNGKIASAGFCWGGAQSFQLAATSDDLDAALVFYGTGPAEENAYEEIDVPVYGFYGGADERINATIPRSEQLMTAAGNTYDYEVYDGAGHAFMRLGEDPSGEPANVAARTAAWERMKQILSSL